QDWDLWYRLAALGTFAIVEECLLKARVTVGSISCSSRDRQSAFARLSRMALRLRNAGQSDASVLEQAKQLRPQKSRGYSGSDQGREFYFIGKCLMDNNDSRAARYFLSAVSCNPFLLQGWWWAVITMARYFLGVSKPYASSAASKTGQTAPGRTRFS